MSPSAPLRTRPGIRSPRTDLDGPAYSRRCTWRHQICWYERRVPPCSLKVHQPELDAGRRQARQSLTSKLLRGLRCGLDRSGGDLVFDRGRLVDRRSGQRRIAGQVGRPEGWCSRASFSCFMRGMTILLPIGLISGNTSFPANLFGSKVIVWLTFVRRSPSASKV